MHIRLQKVINESDSDAAVSSVNSLVCNISNFIVKSIDINAVETWPMTKEEKQRHFSLTSRGYGTIP